MDAATEQHVRALKEALQTLKHTGADGFEGLLASVLSEICGQPFRLASSGSQRGRDGDSAYDAGATYFEAKLYKDDVPRAAVSSKILELSVDEKGQVDTWALCATSAISTQHADLYREALADAGIGCLIVDWPDHTLPPLAVLLAMAPTTTEKFLNDHSQDKAKVVNARLHLEAIAADSLYSATAAGLRDMLREPTLGLGITKAANKAWLVEAFSDRKLARQFFGQPLAPLDPVGLTWVDRKALINGLAGAFSGVPDEMAFVVIGEEGTGKSWLAAKGWLASNRSPLLAVFTADELRLPTAMHDIEGMLIEKLATQSDTRLTEVSRLRWQRRFKGWQANPMPENVRLTVWVDGLNQAQDFPWPRWIDAASKVLSKLGGRLIVTTNERHFARIRSVITAPVRRLVVQEWSESELRSILASKKIESDRLTADVFGSLRNQRILGIAIELLNAKDIEGFDELTVGRLLFEHIRRSERDGMTVLPAEEFAKGLRSHADTIISRMADKKIDDLKLFDVPLDQRLKAVSDSRFFRAVSNEPTLYEIRDDGLPLALGLSLLGELLKELRNGRDPAKRLADIIEPILALTQTSDVIFSALQVACLEAECPTEVRAALAQYYVGLQNVSDAQWPAFESLVRAAPESFVVAAQNACLSGTHHPNMKWLTAALLSARADPAGQKVILGHVLRWLSYYSLSPERRMYVQEGRDAHDKVQAERAKRQAELDAKLSGLTELERRFLETRLTRCDEKGLSSLHLLSFELLAGIKLSQFGDVLVNWAFANALNSGLDSPDRQFQHFITFNAADWRDTRDALLRAAAPLMESGASSTAEWALVAILRATGDSQDAARAKEIAKRLTKDWPQFSGSKRLDTRTETDPCDPASALAGNVDKIVASHERLDVALLRDGISNTRQDYFFDDARPGLARFKPEVAIAVRRKFARNVLEREGLPQRQGVLALLPDSPILDGVTINGLIVLAQSAAGDASDSDSNKRDIWITGQYALFAALPHKNGNEQLAIIASLPGHSLLLRMLQHVSSADEAAAEEHLERVLQSNDPHAQARVLSFIHHSHSPLSKRARQALALLMKSPDKMVRTQAIGIAAGLRDNELLKWIAESGWDAKALDPKTDYFELWYGSSAILAAAEQGLLDPAEAIDRMAAGFYGVAVRRLTGDGAKVALSRLHAALKRAVDLTDIPEFPLVEQPVPSDTDKGPPLLSLVDEQSSNIHDFFDRINETDDAYQARQKRAWSAFDRFNRQLTSADARIVLDDFSWDVFKRIVATEPVLAKSWTALLQGLPSKNFRSLHFFALGLARAIAKIDPAAAVELFGRLATETPLVNRVVGPAEIPAEAVAVWSCADVHAIKSLCFGRLDRAADDATLAVEVLAAFSVGMQAVISEYVDIMVARDEPAPIARALAVSGFSEANAHAASVRARFSDRDGFVGSAYKAARYAYERNEWARHWFEKMKATSTPDEFWSYAVLFSKLVDGRYVLWKAEDGTPEEMFERFFATVEERMNNRIKKWQDKRRKTLFGQAIPDPIFVWSWRNAPAA